MSASTKKKLNLMIQTVLVALAAYFLVNDKEDAASLGIVTGVFLLFPALVFAIPKLSAYMLYRKLGKLDFTPLVSESAEDQIIVDDLAEKAKVASPKCTIVTVRRTDRQVLSENAHARGLVCRKSITMTRKVLALDEEPKKALIAHEMAHIAHHDTKSYLYNLMTSSMLLQLGFKAIVRLGGDNYGQKLVRQSLPHAALFILFLLNPMWYSRQCEYHADEKAVKLLDGDSQALITLFKELGLDEESKQYHARGRCSRFVRSLFSTHPSLEKRVARLQKLGEVGRLIDGGPGAAYLNIDSQEKPAGLAGNGHSPVYYDIDSRENSTEDRLAGRLLDAASEQDFDDSTGCSV